jgi:hypothetical protein
VAEFRDLSFIVIIQMLARAKDLDRGDPGLLDSCQQRRSQAMVDEQMRRQCVIH